MNRKREKLQNANEWCHIYTDIDGITNIHNTKTNETYRIIPETSALGFQLERHKDGELKTRNTISFDELKILTDLVGSNHLLQKLDGKGGEAKQEKAVNKYDLLPDVPDVVSRRELLTAFRAWWWGNREKATDITNNDLDRYLGS